MNERESFLRNVPLFRSLDHKDSLRLAETTRILELKKGDVLFRKGHEGESLFVIYRGKIKIILPSRLGDEMILAVFSKGDFFGEMAVLDGMPRSADAVAMEDTELIVLDRTAFMGFLKNNETALEAILCSLSMRLRKTDDLLEDTCFLNISARFAKRLVELAENYGRRSGDSILIDLEVTQSDLARMVGATRESINKELRVLREKGLVSTIGSKITIYNIALLRRRIH
jgi:CRP-like cAMP-binding protein